MLFLKYYLIYIAWLAALYVTGGLLFSLVCRHAFRRTLANTLINLILGLVVTVTVFSLVRTGFRSVHIAFIPLLAFAWIESARIKPFHAANAEASSGIGRSLLFVLSASLVFFIWGSIKIFNTDNPFGISYQMGDNVVYSRISHYLAATGEENGFAVLNTLDRWYNGTEPYHFFDLWANAMVSALTGGLSLATLFCVIYPTFYLLCFLSVLLLFRRMGGLVLFIAFLLLFCGGLYPDTYKQTFLGGMGTFDFSLMYQGYGKLASIYLFFLCSYLLYREKHIPLAALSLNALAVTTAVSWPTLFPSLILLACAGYFLKIIERKEALRMCLYTAITMLCLVVFYTLAGRGDTGLAGTEITDPLHLLKTNLEQPDWLTRRNIAGASVIYLAIFFAPFLPLITILLREKKERGAAFLSPALFISSVVFFGIAAWALLFRELNACQVFYSAVIPLFNTALMALIAGNFGFISRAVREKKRVVVAAVALAAVPISAQVANTFRDIADARRATHSSAYLETVAEHTGNSRTGASIKAGNRLTNIFVKYNAVYPLGDYFAAFSNNTCAVNIGDMDTPVDSSSQLSMQRTMVAMKNGLFYRFVKAQEAEGTFVSMERSQVEFIRKHRLDFVIADKGISIPADIINGADTVFADSLSGEQFVVLHYPTQ